MRPVCRGPAPTHITSRGPQPLLPENYNFFAAELIRRLGEYCSYCEVPLGASLAIEHILAKSFDFSQETRWENFLLACVNCNSTKGTRVTAASELPNYVWPCQSTATFNTFDAFQYTWDTTKAIVVVSATPSTSPAGSRAAAATATIDLVKLNRYDPLNADPKVSDRRVANRTRAWGTATALAAKLAGYYTRYNTVMPATLAATQASADPAIQLLVRQIAATAVATGFWSVWMTVFKSATYTFINDTVRNELLCRMFVSTFPGTNYAIGSCPGISVANCGTSLPTGT
jgi:hypothetical protein